MADILLKAKTKPFKVRLFMNGLDNTWVEFQPLRLHKKMSFENLTSCSLQTKVKGHPLSLTLTYVYFHLLDNGSI